MRILLINSEYPPIGGGAGNASAHLAQTMNKLGHEVTVLTSRFEDLEGDELQDGVRILRAPAMRRKIDRSGALEQGLFIFMAMVWSIKLVRKWRPTVVLAFFGVPSGAVALILNIVFRIPYIVSLRGGDVPGFRPYDFALYHKLIGPALHIIWRRAQAVAANSLGLHELAQKFDSHVHIHVIPNGVDTVKYSNEARAWKPARLLIVGRVVYQKGIDLLLDALAGIDDMAWNLSIAGGGKMRVLLEQQAIDLGIKERVSFLGWLSKKDLIQCYRHANLFVYPSRHEGMPNVVLEAMACGLAVIASNIAGNEELVIESETGLLVPTEDAAALREAIRDLIRDPSRREKMGEAGRRRVEENYTWVNTAEQYLKLISTNVELS